MLLNKMELHLKISAKNIMLLQEYNPFSYVVVITNETRDWLHTSSEQRIKSLTPNVSDWESPAYYEGRAHSICGPCTISTLLSTFHSSFSLLFLHPFIIFPFNT